MVKCNSLLTGLLSALLFCLPAYSAENWQRTYGGANTDYGWSVQPTPDSGYIVAGATKSFGAGGYDYYLLKLDSAGDTLWTKTYGGTSADLAYSVDITDDGGYVVAGWTTSFGATSGAIYIVKTNAVGDTQWTRKYTNNYAGYPPIQGWTIFQTMDKGYFISSASSGLDFLVIKTDSLGDSLWSKTYGTVANTERSLASQSTLDEGYIIGGYQRPYVNNEAPYLVKINAMGDTIWTKLYRWPINDDCSSIRQTADSGYLIAGATTSFGAGMCDGYMMKLDAKGDSIWMKTYGGPSDDWPAYVQLAPDGGYILAGGTVSYAVGGVDIYLIKTDSMGDTTWTRTFGGELDEDCSSVQPTPDGGYVIAGLTTTWGAGGMDVFIVKTDAAGLVGVAEDPLVKYSLPDTKITAWPNPFTKYTSIPGCEKELFAIYDVLGRLVGTCQGNQVGKELTAGVYFISSLPGQSGSRIRGPKSGKIIKLSK